jgi:hypothetical protein
MGRQDMVTGKASSPLGDRRPGAPSSALGPATFGMPVVCRAAETGSLTPTDTRQDQAFRAAVPRDVSPPGEKHPKGAGCLGELPGGGAHRRGGWRARFHQG